MHVGFSFELLTIDLWNIDLLDTHLDLLDTDIPSKYFACLHNIFKTSSRHVFKTSSRHVFKTFSRHVFKTSSRHVFKTSSRHVFKTCLQDIFKTCLQDVFKAYLQEVPKRCLQDVFNTSSRPANVLLGSSHFSHDVVFFFLQISEVCSLKSIY